MKTNIPDAFKKKMPKIRPYDGHSNAMALIRPTQNFKMGKILIAYSPQYNELPAILSIQGKDKYPTWDEMVWVRYQICPDIEDMALILPPLERYINYTDGRGKYTFTMEAVERGRNRGY